VKSPEDKIKNWERAIIINDARNASQSDLNDENIRLILENFLVNLFKINRYKVTTSSSRSPSVSSTQITLLNSVKSEIIVLLTRKRKISKILTERGDDEVYNDEVKKILIQKGFDIKKWGKIESIINKRKSFIRPRSQKAKGWQVTFRGNKPDSFKTLLEKGNGFLLMPRGPILLIPLETIRDFINENDKTAFERDTIDVFIRFYEEKILIVYKYSELNITQYSIQPYSS
jgi:hypothetical protein